MSLKLEFVGEGRLYYALDSRLLAAFIRRAYCKAYAGSRYVFTIAHDLMHLMSELWHWFIYKPPIFNFLDWLDPCTDERSKVGNKMRAIVYSEKLRVRFFHLAERASASVDVSRKASPRHQDRGSGDAVTDNDNLEKERKLNIAAVAAVRATFIYRLSLNTGGSSNAGRRYLGFLRQLNVLLLQ